MFKIKYIWLVEYGSEECKMPPENLRVYKDRQFPLNFI